MSKQVEKALMPKLRFSEFRDAGEWQKEPFSKLFEIGGGKDYKHLSIGDVPVYGSGGYMLSVGEYLYDGESACIGRKGTINNPLFLTGKFWTVDTLFYTHSLRKCLPKFIYLIFQNINWLLYNEAGGVPSLSKVIISKIEAHIPELNEQQKIADCFSSIDDLIATHNQKHDALKAHKKGLMQQLFPSTGETTPKLRFPEFKDAGAWEEKSLGSFCIYWNGASHEGAVIENGNYHLISLNSIDINGNLKSSMKRLSYTDNSLQKNDLVMVLSDVAHGNFLGLTDIIFSNNFVLNQRMAGLRIKDLFLNNIVFLRIYINYNQKYFKQKGQGSSQLNLSKASVTDFPVLCPNIKEQQKIADCLSSLDDLITTHAQKHNALKAHKKGLMQQLFPPSEKVRI